MKAKQLLNLIETGEADQDYDHEFYSAVAKQITKATGLKAKHKEFDKYQGVYIDVAHDDVPRLWTMDVYYRGKPAKPTTKWAKAKLIDGEGNEFSANAGDYWNLGHDHKFTDHTLVLTQHDGVQKTIVDPTVGDMPDLTQVGWAGIAKDTEVEVTEFWPDGEDEDVRIEVTSKGGKIDTSELVDYIKVKMGKGKK